MANLKAKVAELEKQDYESAPRLGNLVWFQTNGLDKPFDDCEKILWKHGLPQSSFKRTKSKAAFSLACHRIRNTTRNADNRVVVRPVKETYSSSRYQISIERVIADKELEYEKELVAVFDKDTEQVGFEGGVGLLGGQVENAIQKHYERYRDRAHAGNLLKYANTLINYVWMGIAVRERGGVWFVPEVYTQQVSDLENAFEDFGATLYVHPVFDTEKWRGNVRSMVDDDLEHDLDTLIGELSRVITTAQDTGEVKAKTLQTRLSRFQEVQKKAKAYETLLDYRAKEVSKKLNTATKQIKAILTGKAGVEVLEAKSKQK